MKIMILKELTLENIRSYKKATISFEKGSTLLSGDIGSGKTSILLSIEFALFGLLRGEISGDHLLRFGCKEATVNLTFTIGNDTVEIKRVLKKSGESVQQSSGHVGVNGVFEEKTAQEIKSTVLDILGYPSDLLHKNPEMFRYTVYTPQEDMKKILYEKEEDRLVQLRKVFDLDKYERIKNNADMYGKELRRKKRNLQNKFEDLSDAKKELKQKKEELQEQKEEEKTIAEKTREYEEKQKNIQQEIKELESNEEDIKKNESKLTQIKSEYQHKKNTLQNLKSDIKSLQKDVEESTTTLEEKPKKSIQECEELQKKIRIKEDKLQEKQEQVNKKLTSIEQRIQDSKKLITDINKLDDCPTCNQKVTRKHKDEVEKREKQKINEYTKKQEKFKEFKQKINEKKDVIKKKKEQIQNLLQKAKSFEDKKQLLQKAKKTKQRQQQKLQEKQLEKTQIKQSLNKISKEKDELQQKVDKHKNFKQKINEKRQEEKQIQNKISKYSNKQSSLKTAMKYTKRDINKLQKDIDDMQEFKNIYDETRKIENWLSNHFTNVISTIEKHVFMKIHERFNNYFQNWFNILIEDEDFMARLNNNFTPILSQNNHETTIKNLSGGEKTSVALSYRLALNRVVNEFLTGIKTKDLLILDEPTDGFSADQLDKVRDVLDALNCEQTILVSHEPKLESYTENIIRIEKKHGESYVH